MSKRYAVFMIDPPWPKRKGGLRKSAPNQTRELDYSTMSLESIEEFLGKLLHDNAEPQHTVFMRTVDQFLHDCESIMKTLGYRMHARLVWNKRNGVAPAFSVRYTHEYILWFYKPKFMPVALEQRGKFGTVLEGGQREHSRKPDEAYTMVEMLFPQAKKLDVFSRERRKRWHQFGDQKEHFNVH